MFVLGEKGKEYDESGNVVFDGLFEKEINYFVDAVVNDKDLSSIAEDGVTVMKMLDAIYRSAESGHEVRL